MGGTLWGGALRNTGGGSAASSDEEMFAEILRQAQSATGGFQDSNDPPVFVGFEPGERPQLGSGPFAALGEGMAGVAQGVGGMVRPRSEADGLIYTWDPGRVEAFQQRLIQSGIVDPKDIRLGSRDAATLNAWRSLVDESAIAMAAGVRKSPWDVLADMGEGLAEGSGREQAPFVGEVSNPADLRRGMRAAAQEFLGAEAEIGDDVIERAIAKYQAAQVSAQRSQYDAANGEGGTVVAPPSFETFAEEEAQRANPVAYDAYRALDAFSTVLEAMGGPRA